MIFINWRQFVLIAAPLTLAVLFVLLMWQARRKPLWAHLLLIVIIMPLALASLALSALFIFFVTIGPNENSNPIPSPDGKLVARTETSGGFGTGATNVKIYSLHGLLSSWVYSGGQESVVSEDIRWLDDHTLEVRYTYDDGHTCDSTRRVRVICLPADASHH